MSRIIRSAMLQVRVPPEIKLASEHVLRRIGLNMTEATEMFLHRLVFDQCIPFEVVALDVATFTRLMADWKEEERVVSVEQSQRRKALRHHIRPKKE